jgi:uncharacterized protein involved in response to NO
MIWPVATAPSARRTRRSYSEKIGTTGLRTAAAKARAKHVRRLTSMHALVHAEIDPVQRGALLAKGFRPFFLCAATYATLAVPLFLLELAGRAGTGSYLVPMYWHAHEMVFGFSMAVLGGFLLTAVGNWTSRRTADGRALAVLVALWIAGRVGMLMPDELPRYVPAILDLAFVPALLFACARPILATRSQRNYGFLALLGALVVANAAVHAAALGLAPVRYQRQGNWVAVDILVVALVVMTGRVVPMFTRSSTRAEGVHGWPALERLAAISVVLVVAMEALEAPLKTIGIVSCLAGVLAGLRMRSWGTGRTLREPLLWILHIGSIWIVIGLILRGAASFSLVPLGSGLHALTAGAIGTLTLGMMTRVALGHTGRILAVPPRIVGAFGAVVVGGGVRVVAPVLWPGALAPLIVAGLLWSSAFAAYLSSYAPVLMAARVDGRPG